MGHTYRSARRDLTRHLERLLDPEEARAEASIWFEEGLGLDPAWLAAHGSGPIEPRHAELLEAWLDRRATGEPWQQILGWTTFRGRRFEVTRDVLAPRPETELLVEAALALGRERGGDRAVDVGTGSGIIAVSLALETPWALSATDISSTALAIARRNAEAHGAAVTFFEGDLLDPMPDPLGIVMANLPYVDPLDRPTLQRELAFEPEIALFGGQGGTDVIRRLLTQASARRAPGCVLEIGTGQGDHLREFARQAGWSSVEVRKDFAGHDRILIALP